MWSAVFCIEAVVRRFDVRRRVLLKISWLATSRCRFIATRIWVKKSAVIVHSTSTESDGSIPELLHLDDRRNAVPHIHLDREGNRDLSACFLDRLPAYVGLPGHVDKQVVGPDLETADAGSYGELVQRRA